MPRSSVEYLRIDGLAEPEGPGHLVLVRQFNVWSVYRRQMDGFWGPLNVHMGTVNWSFLINTSDEIVVLEPKVHAYRQVPRQGEHDA
jgi:hypothetical protein